MDIRFSTLCAEESILLNLSGSNLPHPTNVARFPSGDGEMFVPGATPCSCVLNGIRGAPSETSCGATSSLDASNGGKAMNDGGLEFQAFSSTLRNGEAASAGPEC